MHWTQHSLDLHSQASFSSGKSSFPLLILQLSNLCLPVFSPHSRAPELGLSFLSRALENPPNRNLLTWQTKKPSEVQTMLKGAADYFWSSTFSSQKARQQKQLILEIFGSTIKLDCMISGNLKLFTDHRLITKVGMIVHICNSSNGKQTGGSRVQG